MYCKSCGMDVVKGMNFCSQCGQKIEKNEEAHFYFEHTIRLDASRPSYQELLELFFAPQKYFDSKERFSEPVFDKIFPTNPDYQKNHEVIKSTRDFLPWNGWVFRGQQNASWPLKTKFDRLYDNISLLSNDKSKIRDKFELEQSLIREFTRKDYMITRKSDSIPIYEVIANMQHYGCATRFLDVSYSFFVALFFACGNLEFSDKQGMFSIWCFNRMWIEKAYKKYLPEKISELYINDKFGKDPETQKTVMEYFKDVRPENRNDIFKTVINMTPKNMNRRLVRQKGSFLIPTNPYLSFEDNISSLVNNENATHKILKINVQYDNLTIIYLQKFLDEMNINHTVLFDDETGLCDDINFKSRLPNDALVTDLRLNGEKEC